MDNATIAGQVEFIHPEKVCFYLPGFNAVAVARLYGLGVEHYRAIRSHFDTVARAAAEELLGPDGLHPSLTAHKVIAWTVIERLAA